MFKRTIVYNLCFVLFFLLFYCSNTNTILSGPNSIEITAVSTFGGSNVESARAVTSTQDGGYAVLGYTQSMDGDVLNKQDNSFDYWVLKFNAQDELEWQNTYGGSLDERGRDIIQTYDGGYAILGFSFSNDGDLTENAGLQDYWLAKLDSNGQITWQKSFGFAGTDSGISVIQTNDQGYLITGILDVTASGGQGSTSRNLNRHAGGDYWVLKLSGQGDLEWSHYFGGNFTDTPEGVVQTADNGYIIAGGSDSNDTDISNPIGSYDFWVIRLSSNGTLVWEKSFGGDQIDEARAIVSSADGNYIIAGDTRSDNNDVSDYKGGADLWLIKISPEGHLIWEKTLGGSNFDVARALTASENGGFLLAGSSRSNDVDVSENKGQNDAWVLKVDDLGSLQWEYTIGGSNIDFAYGVTELNDGAVIAVGDTASDDGDILQNKGFSDVLIIKLN
ncbi:hypothetical protein [Winogradskyella aurantia]|uniref:Bulb-type lectin domain-containing protein n=1 Tax=Winogradskyella aurantia TaxID=1915063 RepID=A0A265V0Y8_9FLAO|nr:hypothetical protein [Winogradskyella aurantia]OZV70957.1 hypothetical protein CA834_02250 [Winogradskyella aurantia]